MNELKSSPGLSLLFTAVKDFRCTSNGAETVSQLRFARRLRPNSPRQQVPLLPDGGAGLLVELTSSSSSSADSSAPGPAFSPPVTGSPLVCGGEAPPAAGVFLFFFLAFIFSLRSTIFFPAGRSAWVLQSAGPAERGVVLGAVLGAYLWVAS